MEQDSIPAEERILIAEQVKRSYTAEIYATCVAMGLDFNELDPANPILDESDSSPEMKRLQKAISAYNNAVEEINNLSN
jgi:hypothetical protein